MATLYSFSAGFSYLDPVTCVVSVTGFAIHTSAVGGVTNTSPRNLWVCGLMAPLLCSPFVNHGRHTFGDLGWIQGPLKRLLAAYPWLHRKCPNSRNAVRTGNKRSIDTDQNY